MLIGMDLVMARRVELRCPICKKPVANTDEEYPFCSARCRTIDLGRWASGQYVVPVSTPGQEEDELPERPQRDPDDER